MYNLWPWCDLFRSYDFFLQMSSKCGWSLEPCPQSAKPTKTNLRLSRFVQAVRGDRKSHKWIDPICTTVLCLIQIEVETDENWLTWTTLIVKTECDLLDSVFRDVWATLLLFCPLYKQSKASSGDLTSTSVTPWTYILRLLSSLNILACSVLKIYELSYERKLFFFFANFINYVMFSKR